MSFKGCIRDWKFVPLTSLLILSSTQAGAGDCEPDTIDAGAVQSYWVEQVVSGLHFPSSMAWVGRSELLITERRGEVRIVRDGVLDPAPIPGTPVSYHSIFDGLKDILVDPDFQENRSIYLLLSEGQFEKRHAALYRVKYGNRYFSDPVRIFSSSDGVGGFGNIVSRMSFLQDKTILLAIPEDRHARAQDLASHVGKILRINRDGSIPKDNPFVTTPGALPEIWSYGHRGPMGIYQDSGSGVVLELESGPRGGDELNVLKSGGNYGWAKASWGFAYQNNGLEAPLQTAPGIEDPILIWMPSVTPSGLTRYCGNAYPAWRGDYFLGHLTTKALERIHIHKGRVILQERLLVDLEERIRDVKVGPDGLIYVLTDHSNGRVLRIRPTKPTQAQHVSSARKLDEEIERVPLWDFPAGGDELISDLSAEKLERGRQAFMDWCSACHSMGAVVQGGHVGPDLRTVYGRLLGRQPGYKYSQNMEGSVFQWKFATLDRFLSNPSSFVPGTSMMLPPIEDQNIRRDIIGFLKYQSTEDRELGYADK